MGRRLREYMPHAVFHITAKAQNDERWFVDDIRSSMIVMLTDSIKMTDARLLALAIMPNHLHVVVVQGHATLSAAIGPALRRISLLVQRRHNVKHHVFGKRFYSLPCTGADHVRNAIVYTHRNPVKANLCTDPCDYPWATHSVYLGSGISPAWAPAVCRFEGLQPFASRESNNAEQLVDDYRTFYDWRDYTIRRKNLNLPLDRAMPACDVGDTHCRSYQFPTSSKWHHGARDLRDTARDALRIINPAVELSNLRVRYLSRQLTHIRRDLMAWLLINGYGVTQIANFFGLTPSPVSTINVWIRKMAILEMPSWDDSMRQQANGINMTRVRQTRVR